MESYKIYMEFVENSRTSKDHINEALEQSQLKSLDRFAKELGRIIAVMHKSGIIHGDLTTSNVLIKQPYDAEKPSLVMIDFGLSYVTSTPAEDKGVDLYVLERALLSSHPNTETLFEVLMESYKQNYTSKELQCVLTKFEEVRARGRKRTMVG